MFFVPPGGDDFTPFSIERVALGCGLLRRTGVTTVDTAVPASGRRRCWTSSHGAGEQKVVRVLTADSGPHVWVSGRSISWSSRTCRSTMIHTLAMCSSRLTSPAAKLLVKSSPWCVWNHREEAAMLRRHLVAGTDLSANVMPLGVDVSEYFFEPPATSGRAQTRVSPGQPAGMAATATVAASYRPAVVRGRR